MKRLLLIFCLCLLSMNLVHANAIETIAEGEQYEFRWGVFEPINQVGYVQFPDGNYREVHRTVMLQHVTILDLMKDKILFSCGIRKDYYSCNLGIQEDVILQLVESLDLYRKLSVDVDFSLPPKFLYKKNETIKVIPLDGSPVINKSDDNKMALYNYKIPETFFDAAKDANVVILELTKTNGDKMQIIFKKADIAKFMAICHADMKQIRRETEQK